MISTTDGSVYLVFKFVSTALFRALIKWLSESFSTRCLAVSLYIRGLTAERVTHFSPEMISPLLAS